MNSINSTQQVRPAAVAGAFYPREPALLAQQLQAMLAAADVSGHGVPKALIVPHAGYMYSGATAARAYACLAGARASIRRVILAGPVHRVALRGLALPGCAAFATPLGQVQIDQAALADLADLPQVVISPAAHAMEHSLEVQLPFLQTVLDEFTLVPLAVGTASAAEVAEVLERLWGGSETLLVISSDLSHFLNYAQARASDGDTVRQILDGNATLNHAQACGATPVNGLLLAARQRHLRAELLQLCNSGDSAGDKRSVVGYAAIAFEEQT